LNGVRRGIVGGAVNKTALKRVERVKRGAKT
jgi:hypothetical protein